MIYKVLEAKATVTELGEFSAIAAAYTVDRGNERILPGAFKGTIDRWQASGKQIPLHWDHSGKAEDIVGTVDPMSLRETDSGLEVSGKLDLEDSDVAREAWRAMKNNSLGLSFGYMVTSGQKADDGVYELKAVDLFEISITPAPMNPDTRFIDFKSVSAPPTAEELRKASGEVERDLQAEKLDGILEEEKEEEPEAPDPFELIGDRLTAIEKTLQDVQDKAIEDAPDEEPEKAKSRAQDPLKQSSLATALEIISDGASLRKYQEPKSTPPPEPPPEPEQWKRWIEAQLD